MCNVENGKFLSLSVSSETNVESHNAVIRDTRSNITKVVNSIKIYTFRLFCCQGDFIL